jgi:phenylpropionate dioxygenase-like ring-hydroxylating dioxygenase large terminal subunit
MDLWRGPLNLVREIRRGLACNWKVAHDNTLDDYHVAVAHPTTLHREQGPVKDYVHRFTDLGNVLITPHAAGGHFHTFGLPPWTHLITWPDGRLALLEFLPSSPSTTTLQLRLFAMQQSQSNGAEQLEQETDAWLNNLLGFLEEDQQLVESAQLGYESGITPGPAHRLEERILHWQRIYRRQLPGSTDSWSSAAKTPWQR